MEPEKSPHARLGSPATTSMKGRPFDPFLRRLFSGRNVRRQSYFEIRASFAGRHPSPGFPNGHMVRCKVKFGLSENATDIWSAEADYGSCGSVFKNRGVPFYGPHVRCFVAKPVPAASNGHNVRKKNRRSADGFRRSLKWRILRPGVRRRGSANPATGSGARTRQSSWITASGLSVFPFCRISKWTLGPLSPVSALLPAMPMTAPWSTLSPARTLSSARLLYTVT